MVIARPRPQPKKLTRKPDAPGKLERRRSGEGWLTLAIWEAAVIHADGGIYVHRVDYESAGVNKCGNKCSPVKYIRVGKIDDLTEVKKTGARPAEKF